MTYVAPLAPRGASVELLLNRPKGVAGEAFLSVPFADGDGKLVQGGYVITSRAGSPDVSPIPGQIPSVSGTVDRGPAPTLTPTSIVYPARRPTHQVACPTNSVG